LKKWNEKMNQNRDFATLLVLIIIFHLSSCTVIRIPENTIKVSDTPIILTSALPTLSTRMPLFPSPTWVPTLSFAYQEKLFDLLHSKDCILPCYLNIQPGITKVMDVVVLFDSMGASYFNSYEEGKFLIDEFHLDVGDMSLRMVTPIDGLDIKISHQILIIVDKNGTVQQIRGSVNTGRRLYTKFENYWSGYTISELLLDYGIPDILNVWASYGGGYGSAFIYEKQGIVFEMNGSTLDNFICLKMQSGVAGLQFTLTNPSSGMSIFNPQWVSPADPDHWFSTEEVLGINKTEFYNIVLTNPSACFEVKKLLP
jgi:hypothetical protein